MTTADEMSDEATRNQLARMDAKLDVLISRHGELDTKVADHEARLRLIETAHTRHDGALAEQGKDLTDHEIRLRSADKWRYALPITAISALAAAAASITAAIGTH
jgi:hypothetical protein